MSLTLTMLSSSPTNTHTHVHTYMAPIQLLKEIPSVQSYLNYDMYFTQLFNEPNLSNLNMYSIQTDLIFLAT